MLALIAIETCSLLDPGELPQNSLPQVLFKYAGVGVKNYEEYHGQAKFTHYHDLLTLDYIGSWCPTEDGPYSIRIGGLGEISMVWFDSVWGNFSQGIGIGSHRTYEYKNIPAKRGTCYPFHLNENSGTLLNKGTLGIEVKRDNEEYYYTSDFIRSSSEKLCLTGYYGRSCSKCTVHCNGRGHCGGKAAREDAPHKCICDSQSQDPFCEPENATYEFEGKKHCARKHIYENERSPDTESSTQTCDLSIEDPEPYTKTVLRGSIFLPQTSKYRFRVLSRPGAILAIGGASEGAVAGPFSCSPGGGPEETIIEIDGSRGLIPFSIEYNSACGFGPNFMRFDWQFVRRYEEVGARPEWEPVPDRYIFS